jgi:RNA-directed DNA polymerase
VFGHGYERLVLQREFPDHVRLCRTRSKTRCNTKSLIRHARYAGLIPVGTFPSEEAFRNAVYQLIVNIRDDIRNNGTYNPFWDNAYDRRKKSDVPQPKRETEIQPTLHLLFAPWALLRGVEILAESRAGIGNLDFCFVGHVAGRGAVAVCVEVKRAHATDLMHGLTVQLPTYMKAKRARYGA